MLAKENALDFQQSCFEGFYFGFDAIAMHLYFKFLRLGLHLWNQK